MPASLKNVSKRVKKVEHINFQSWLLVNFSKKKLDSFDGEDMYLKQGLEEFKEDSWDPKVDRSCICLMKKLNRNC